MAWLRFGAWLLLSACLSPSVRAEVVPLTDAEICAVPCQGQWTPVRLPHDWRDQSRPFPQSLWYRLHYRGGPAARALLVDRITLRGQVWLNGVPVPELSYQAASGEMHWNLPYFFRLPAAAERTENELLIRVDTRLFYLGGMAAPVLGPEPEVLALYLRQDRLARALPMAAAGILLTLSIMGLTFWWQRRDRTYLYFTLDGLILLVRLVLPALAGIPDADTPWLVLYFTLPAWNVFLMALFLIRMGQPTGRRTEWLLLGCMMLTPLVFLAGQSQMMTARLIVYLLVAVIALPLLLRQLAVFWRKGYWELVVIAAAVSIQILQVGQQWLTVGAMVSFPVLYHGPHLVILALCVGAFSLTRRFERILSEHEHLNSSLEADVEKNRQELLLAFARVQAGEKQQAVDGERLRLMQEMHDGLGSQLTAALHLAEHSQTPDALRLTLRDAMDQLRLLIDSLEPVEDDLATVLGNLRYRLGSRLEAAGLALRWEVDTVDPMPLPPPVVLNIQRIVQEALTNILKHADAATITVSLGRMADGRIFIRVDDDGRGPQPGSHPPGKGLANMQRRARECGGAVRLFALHPQGSRLELVLSA